MEIWEKMFLNLGIVFILFGLALIIIPLIIRYLPSISIERIPWIILWIYRKDNFFFATSPILIIIGIIYMIWILIKLKASYPL
ncbi:MAG: hypothetical protein QXX09_02715 [Candidatus Methanomethylicia archaeon]